MMQKQAAEMMDATAILRVLAAKSVAYNLASRSPPMNGHASRYSGHTRNLRSAAKVGKP